VEGVLTVCEGATPLPVGDGTGTTDGDGIGEGDTIGEGVGDGLPTTTGNKLLFSSHP